MLVDHSEPQFIFIEGPSMPQRLLKPLFAFLSSSDSPTFLGVVVSFIVSVATSWYSNRSAVEIVLGACLLFDYWTGYLVAEKRGVWNWERGAQGFKVKFTLYIGVLLAGWAAKMLGSGDVVVVALDTGLCCHEGRSAIRNLKNLGVKGLDIFDAFLTKSTAQSKVKAGIEDGTKKGE